MSSRIDDCDSAPVDDSYSYKENVIGAIYCIRRTVDGCVLTCFFNFCLLLYIVFFK
jgi:hypothetical protein